MNCAVQKPNKGIYIFKRRYCISVLFNWWTYNFKIFE